MNILGRSPHFSHMAQFSVNFHLCIWHFSVRQRGAGYTTDLFSFGRSAMLQPGSPRRAPALRLKQAVFGGFVLDGTSGQQSLKNNLSGEKRVPDLRRMKGAGLVGDRPQCRLVPEGGGKGRGASRVPIPPRCSREEAVGAESKSG